MGLNLKGEESDRILTAGMGIFSFFFSFPRPKMYFATHFCRVLRTPILPPVLTIYSSKSYPALSLRLACELGSY